MTADEAVRDHSRLVWREATRAYQHGIGHRLGSVADCAQVGFLGLMNAARLYDTSKGSFATYATPAIRNAITFAAGSLAYHASESRTSTTTPSADFAKSFPASRGQCGSRPSYRL